MSLLIKAFLRRDCIATSAVAEFFCNKRWILEFPCSSYSALRILLSVWFSLICFTSCCRKQGKRVSCRTHVEDSLFSASSRREVRDVPRGDSLQREFMEALYYKRKGGILQYIYRYIYIYIYTYIYIYIYIYIYSHEKAS